MQQALKSSEEEKWCFNERHGTSRLATHAGGLNNAWLEIREVNKKDMWLQLTNARRGTLVRAGALMAHKGAQAHASTRKGAQTQVHTNARRRTQAHVGMDLRVAAIFLLSLLISNCDNWVCFLLPFEFQAQSHYISQLFGRSEFQAL